MSYVTNDNNEEFTIDSVTPGEKVYARDGKTVGETTGSIRACTLEGCCGSKLGVRWPKKKGYPKITFPCTEGMSYQDNVWRIL